MLDNSSEELHLLFEDVACEMPTAPIEPQAVANRSKSQRRLRYVAKSGENQAINALMAGKK